MKELEGKVALVTGASRGIGKAIALQFASMGATVIVNYSGSKEKAEKVLSEIKEAGSNGCIYQCDVADFEAVGQMMSDVVQKYNKIDILVNNAGITKDGLLMKMSSEDFDAVVNVNLKGTFNCIRQVTRQMLKQRSGRIINMSSIVGIMGNAGQVNYSATKAGVIGITKSAAKELASRGITVNAIAPGYVGTDMTEVLSEAVKEKIVNTIPLNRMGQPQDIAKTAGFLASDGGAYITGQVISVDGGMSIN
ncbi:MAG: 3-oxoacyl-[acyl-carrier-protein] reductase [Eubacteriales bacterium]|nr:3-oxoacyl-[acyl-carrier-protein] reductase [Eubacteriales bacterium]